MNDKQFNEIINRLIKIENKQYEIVKHFGDGTFELFVFLMLLVIGIKSCGR